MNSASGAAAAIAFALTAIVIPSAQCFSMESLSATAATSHADQISGAKRYDRRARYRPAPANVPHWRGFADPSFGPDGKPYPVPENLRNQCYIDMGYGRFQSCLNR